MLVQLIIAILFQFLLLFLFITNHIPIATPEC